MSLSQALAQQQQKQLQDQHIHEGSHDPNIHCCAHFTGDHSLVHTGMSKHRPSAQILVAQGMKQRQIPFNILVLATGTETYTARVKMCLLQPPANVCSTLQLNPAAPRSLHCTPWAQTCRIAGQRQGSLSHPVMYRIHASVADADTFTNFSQQRMKARTAAGSELLSPASPCRSTQTTAASCQYLPDR